MERVKRRLIAPIALGALLAGATAPALAGEYEIEFRKMAEAGRLFYWGYSNDACTGKPALETHLFAALKLSGIKAMRISAGPDAEYEDKPCVSLPQTTRMQRFDCRNEIAKALGIHSQDIKSILVRQTSKYDTRIVVSTSVKANRSSVPASVCLGAFKESVTRNRRR